MNEMDCPSPQPGQKSNPAFFMGQMLKCDSEGSITISTTRPVDQITASNGKDFRNDLSINNKPLKI